MSAAAATTDAAAGQAPARPKKRRLMMIALVSLLSLVALVGGLAAAMGPSALISFLTGSQDELAGEPIPPAGESGHDAAADPTLAVMPFDEIIVNITDVTAAGRRTTRFLKLNIALVYDDKLEDADQVKARQLYMRDAFQDYLRQLTVRDLQGSLGLASLKAELLRRARAISGSEAPAEFLVSDLVIQ